jgi:ubiquinone biosynthesis protein
MDSSDSPPLAAVAPPPYHSEADVFMSLPRRKSFRAEGVIVDAPTPATLQTNPKPTPREIISRYWVYGTFFLRFTTANAFDRLRGRASIARRAVRLRKMVQKLGPTSIKIGQQLGTRTDILRREYCDELNRLLDQVDPIPREVTIKVLEAEWHRPLAEIFSAFDLEPIGSGSIASVYQACLLDGTKVAVKVRRPKVDRILQADFVVLRSLTRWLERLSLIRPGRSKPVLDELEEMLGDELDFILESRQTALFRREAKEIKYVTAPRIFSELCTKKVMVSEFVTGISMNEIINAVQKRDLPLLGELEAMGYDFKRISRRLLRMYFWQTFEAAIFHADLHPANIFVTPENSFVLVDFGCCGTLSKEYRHALVGFMRSLATSDVAGAAQFMIMMNEPLPLLNYDQYKFEMERVVRKFIIMNRSKKAPWHEKCWGGAMKDFIELSRRHGIPMRAELLRYSRANSHLDFMVYRLYPQADPRREFYKWYAQRAARTRKQFRRELTRQAAIFLDAASVGLGDLGQTSFQFFSRLRSSLDRRPVSFQTGVNKFPFAAAVLIRFVMNVVFLLFLAVVGRVLVRVAARQPVMVGVDDAVAIAVHPLFLLAVLGLFLISLRKILVRTIDPDIK